MSPSGVVEHIFIGTTLIFLKLIYFFSHYHSEEIAPKKNTNCYDIPLHLREAAKDEFNEMIKAGIEVEADGEPNEWASLAFPRRKPNSFPAKM